LMLFNWLSVGMLY